MTEANEISPLRNLVNGLILLIYLAGFMLFIYGSWERLWTEAGNPPLSGGAFLLFMVFSAVIFLSAATTVVKKVIQKKRIEINFWTFVPVIYYGIIYSWFYFHKL